MSGQAGRIGSEAAALAALLPPLLAEARAVAASSRSGAHGRRRSGPGDAFWQFRRYQPGDTADEIDWRQTAKSAHAFVREKEWEVPDRVWLWVDPSASMNWRSGTGWPQKRDRALVLAVALAYLLAEGGETFQALGGAEGERLPDVERLAQGLLSCPPSSSWPVPPSRHRDRIVLLSDFLLTDDQIAELFGLFGGHDGPVHLVRVLDPAELSFPYAGRTRFTGLEGEGEVLISRAEDLRQAYLTRIEALGRKLKDGAEARRWSFSTSVTGQPAADALSALHAAIRGA